MGICLEQSWHGRQRLEIYPGFWDEPENVGYLLEDVRRLRETVSDVASRGLGLLVSIS